MIEPSERGAIAVDMLVNALIKIAWSKGEERRRIQHLLVECTNELSEDKPLDAEDVMMIDVLGRMKRFLDNQEGTK